MAGLCGKGIVLAYKNKPEASDEAFQQAHNPGLRPAGKAKPPSLVLQNFLLQMPDLSRAVSAAVLRNEENLNGAKKSLPAGLQWLKSPATLVTGPGK
jgi:hypothetical protein